MGARPHETRAGDSVCWVCRVNSKVHRARWKRIRIKVLARDRFACVQCGRSGGGRGLEVDHVRRVADGGELYSLDNLQTLCGGRNGCHARKTAVENGRDTTQEDAFDAIIDRLMTENDTMCDNKYSKSI